MNKCLVVLMLAGIVSVSAQANMVYNGDFNTGDLDGWWAWAPDPDNQSVTPQSVVNYDGTTNAMMVSASDGAWQELGTNAFACSETTTYTVSLVYNEVDWVGAGINLKYWDAGWTVVGEQWIDLVFSSNQGTEEWIPFSTDFTSVAGAANMEVKIAMGGWGTLYVEDVSVVPEPATMALIAIGSALLLRRPEK